MNISKGKKVCIIKALADGSAKRLSESPAAFSVPSSFFLKGITPHMVAKVDAELLTQVLPAPDEAQLTCCPHCRAEYDIQKVEGDKLYKNVAGPYFRHLACGNVVKFEGWETEKESQ